SPPKNGAHRATVDDRPRQIDQVRDTEFVEERFPDLLPHTVFLPVAQAAPTRHAATATHLLREILPRCARLQNENDAGQTIPVRYSWSPAFGLRLFRRQQRFDALPQLVR